MEKFKDKTIIILSNEPWGDVWYSKHNYAYELSKNNTVLFLNPAKKWHFKNLFLFRFNVKKASDTLYITDYTNLLPARFKLLFEINNLIVSKLIYAKLKRHKLIPDIFITFDPYRLSKPSLFKVKKSLFICVDDFDFKHIGEESLCKNIDYIVTVSDVLSQKYERFKKPVLTISHGISSEEFKSIHPYEDVKKYGLYIGTIDKRLDFEITESLLKRFPDVPFVFVGGVGEKGIEYINKYRTLYPNFFHIGTKPFKELKNYIYSSDFCLAPMNIREPGNDISHHKIFQYLAFGKPVFSTKFREYTDISDLFYMENNCDKLCDNLNNFLTKREDEELKNKRINFAKTKTYEEILRKIELFIND
jgi:hypothetical protein